MTWQYLLMEVIIELFYNRASYKFSQKKYKEAIEDYTKAINAKKDFSYAYNDRGSAKRQFGRL